MKRTILFIAMLAIASSVMTQNIDSTKQQKSKFPVWKTIKVGGEKDKYKILKDFKKFGSYVSIWANDAINQESFKVSSKKRKAKLALVTIEQLGFTPENFSMYAFYRKAEESGLKLCSPELVLYLSRNNTDFKEGDVVYIGMDTISDSRHIGILGLYVKKNDGHRVVDADKDGNITRVMEFVDKNGNHSRNIKDKDCRIYYSIDLFTDNDLLAGMLIENYKWVFEIKE